MPARLTHLVSALLVCSFAACAKHEEEPSETGGAQSTGVAGTGPAATTPPPSAGTAAAGTTAGSAGAKSTATGGAGTGGAGTTEQVGQTPAAGSGAAGVTAAAGSGGNAAAAAGGGGAGGTTAAAGAGGTETGQAGRGGTIDARCAQWPTPTGDESLAATMRVSGSFDGKLKRFKGAGALGGGGQDEGQDPMFLLSNGAVLENVILGAPAADGVHCEGSCTLRNVWWEDVGEDAATLKGSSQSQVMSIECGGARKASDKVFQHNGPGTMKISSFTVDDFGKLYRSCGNCKTQHERHVEMDGIDATKGKVLAGINTNYGDTATFKNITLHDSAMKMEVCDRFTGNDSGDEPSKTGSGADGKSCIYEDADISWAQ